MVRKSYGKYCHYRADFGDFSAIQFLTVGALSSGNASLQYDLLDNGLTMATGAAAAVGPYNTRFHYFGLSAGG